MELAYQYKNQDYDVTWFNGAIKNRKKFEINKSDYLSRLFYRAPNKIIKQILIQDGIKCESEYIKINKKSSANLLFKDIDELKTFYYKNVPLGQIIFSGMATKLKHTGFSIAEVIGEVEYFSCYLLEFEKKLVSIIKTVKPDVVVTINDRLPGSAICISYARNLGILTKVYYWGSGMHRITGYDNSLYDFNEWRCMIKTKYRDKPICMIQKNLVLNEIEHLANRPPEDSNNFLSYQIPGTSIKKRGKMIVFYATSEFEHSPIISRKYNSFLTQYQAFEVLQTLCIKSNYQLIFKHHPPRKKRFLKHFNNKNIYDWKKVKFHKDTTQLMPDSIIDTYQLLKDADINVTWGSTVGLESIVREKPTIVLGDTPWLNTEWGIHAWDEETLKKLLASYSYTLKKDALIPWFYFMQDYGEAFKFVETKNYNPSVRGIKVLQPRWPFVLFYKLAVKLKEMKII